MDEANDFDSARATAPNDHTETRHTRRQHLSLLAGGLAAATVWPRAAESIETDWPGSSWSTLSPTAAEMNAGTLRDAVRFASSKGGAGFVARYGFKVAEWGDTGRPIKLYSATKGFGSLLLGLALKDGRLDLDDRAVRYMPGFGTPPARNKSNGWADQVTIRMLATHTAGFDMDGGFEPILFKPGTRYKYSNGGPNWLADILTLRFDADLDKVLAQRVLGPIGVTRSDWYWRKNIYRPQSLQGHVRREFGSGIYMNARAFARVGLLMNRHGAWRGRQVIPEGYLRQATRPDADLRNIRSSSSGDYSLRNLNLLIQNNATGVFRDMPKDMFMFRGKYLQHVVCVPSRSLVIVRLGEKGWGSSYEEINRLFRGFVRAAR